MENIFLFQVGCDMSLGLLNVCKDRNFEVFTGNCLNLPLKDNVVDGAICIAVIHHLGNEVRITNNFFKRYYYYLYHRKEE